LLSAVNDEMLLENEMYRIYGSGWPYIWPLKKIRFRFRFRPKWYQVLDISAG